ncbi:MAG TPA: glycosyltransferase [Vicinamibacterales bacterium]|nr:glycosyltransferase [Vicinamibacterales bacterium]
MFDIERRLAFSYPSRELAVVGWCCFDDLTPVDELYATHAGSRVPCFTGVRRPDIARSLDAAALMQSGFLCRLPVSGSSKVTLVAPRAGVDCVIGEFAVAWQKAERFPEDQRDAYSMWLRRHEAALHWAAADVEARLGSLASTPVVSVLLPTYNTNLYHLHRCIESVATQRYPHWELCITDDGSTDSRVARYLKDRASADPRIRLSFAAECRGISAASNISLAGSVGEFVVLLDHDDELHPAALLEVARCLNDHPDSDLIYSDEDKIDQLGVRSGPAFKPEFDDDLLCGFDYIGHLVAIRTALAREVGGFRSDTDGAQDWDLLLRVTSASDRRRIQHIPKPLYHWRKHEESTAYSLDAKPYAVRAWDIVLRRHLASARFCSVREGLFRGSMRVARAVPPETRVSVVYRAGDGLHQRGALARSRVPRRTTFFEVAGADIRCADHSNGTCPSGVHSGGPCPPEAESDVMVVINGALESVNHHFIEELAAQAGRDDCGVVGGTVLRPDRTVLTAGLVSLHDGTALNPFDGMAVQDLGYMGLAKVVRSVASIGPQVFAFRTSRLRDLGAAGCVDEHSLGDLCAALIRHAHAGGLKVLHTPYAIATMHGSAESFAPPRGDAPPGSLMLNRNLEGFPTVASVLKRGIN